MARRQIGMKEIMEAIYQWHQGISIRRIRDSLGIERRTIKNYLTILESLGIRRGSPLPEPTQLAEMLKANLGSRGSALTSAPAQKAIDAFHSQIAQWMEEEDMTAKQVWRLLKEKGLDVGYTSIKRYFRLEFPSRKKGVTVRLEVSPGHQAQVDFGYAGLMNDPETGKLRRTWVFIMIHASSRYPFVRFVFNQDQINWVDCHCRAFEFFSGVPATVVLDNLKAGVIKPDIYDPTINRAYSECERYYGFVADPAKSRSPKLKTHLSTGLAIKACSEGYRVLFMTVQKLLEDLMLSKRDGSIAERLLYLSRLHLLAIDELGYMPITKEQANLLFQLISMRYEKGSIILTSNYNFDEWDRIFEDTVVASAVIDRLVHHAAIFYITGNSYRLRNKLRKASFESGVNFICGKGVNSLDNQHRPGYSPRQVPFQ